MYLVNRFPMFGRFRREVLRGGGVRIVRGTRKPRFKKGGHSTFKSDESVVW